ncbi:MAG: hypothetical protein ACOZEN_06375 [Thermodesulfobacteriota bacterium]
MIIKRLGLLLLIAALSLAAGCQSASKQAHQEADAAMYQPIEYPNASKPGPQVVVIPGAVKSQNATFAQKYGPNNIADFAEIELSKDNFKVLERQDLGPMLQEIEVAANLGDAKTLKKFKKGKMQATNWLIRFDILKAEPVAQVEKKFDGTYLGIIAGSAVGGATNSWAAGAASGAAVGSIKAEEASGIWIVGLRFKVLDANTGEQVVSDYFEDKMEISSKGGGALGYTEKKTTSVTLDTMVQRLVQRAVQKLDAMK